MTDGGQQGAPETAGSGDGSAKAARRWGAGRITLVVLGSLVVLFLLIQLLPLGRDHSAPPVTAEPTWPSLEAKVLARRACYDCHSNETSWPWYSNIVPVSLLVSHDVDEARGALNFSEWDRAQPELREITEAIGEGSMPPPYYKWFHPDAKLTTAERQQLVAGLDQMWATNPPPAG
jgi:hypothetical protein